MADEKDLTLGGPDDEQEPELVYDPIELMDYMMEAYNFLDGIDVKGAGFGPKTEENVKKARKKCLELVLSTIMSL